MISKIRLENNQKSLVTLPLNLLLIQKPAINYEATPRQKNIGMTIDLSKTKITKPSGLVDTITSIENVKGTHYDDYIYGDNKDNELNGLDGNDNIYGKAGNDKLIFGYGYSNLYGGKGNDKFTFIDSSMNYQTTTITGVANIYGGEDYDILDLKFYPLPIQVNLTNNSISYNTSQSYILESIEKVITTNLNDIIYDSQNNDDIDSGKGNDMIYLTNGEDFVNAGAGNDIIFLLGSGEKRIYSGDGKDIYIVMPNFISHNSTIILDFKPHSDKIDLTNFNDIHSYSDLSLEEVTKDNLNFTILTISENIALALYNIRADEIYEHSFIF